MVIRYTNWKQLYYNFKNKVTILSNKYMSGIEKMRNSLTRKTGSIARKVDSSGFTTNKVGSYPRIPDPRIPDTTMIIKIK